jgi:putative flippase GtrA
VISRFLARYRGSLGQLVKFSLVGFSGVLINFLVVFAAKKITPLIWESAHTNGVWWHIPGTDFNIRWFSVYSMVAFVVANVSNYQINRSWSFKSKHHDGWMKEFLPFFTIGLLAQCLGMAIEVALMNQQSPISLPSSVFDDSTGFRTKFYWAHLIMIAVTTPLSFLANKFWTFRSIRRPGVEPIEPIEQAET